MTPPRAIAPSQPDAAPCCRCARGSRSSCACSRFRARGTTRRCSATASASALEPALRLLPGGMHGDGVQGGAGAREHVLQRASVSRVGRRRRARARGARRRAAGANRAFSHGALRSARQRRRPARLGGLAAVLLARRARGRSGSARGPLAVVGIFLAAVQRRPLRRCASWGLRMGWTHGLRVAAALGESGAAQGPQHIGRAAPRSPTGIAIPLALGARASGPGRLLLGGVLVAGALSARSCSSACTAASKAGGSSLVAARALRPHLGGSLMPERTVQIVNKNGLHARPAAEIVKLAAKFQSEITLVRDDLEVNGKSIMGVMMLAAECGSTITACAPTAPTRSRRSTRSATLIAQQVRRALVDRQLIGIPASPGIVVGPVHLLRWEVPGRAPPHHPRRGDPRRDRATPRRARRARRSACASFATRVEAHRRRRGSGDLRRAALDPRRPASSSRGVEELIRQNLGAEKAFEIVMFEWRQRFARARAPDAARARRRSDGRPHPRALAPARICPITIRSTCPKGANAILVTHDLTPSLTVQLDREAIAAIATDAGTRTSHVAILARSLGLPAIVGLRTATQRAARAARRVDSRRRRRACSRSIRRDDEIDGVPRARARGGGRRGGARRARGARGGHDSTACASRCARTSTSPRRRSSPRAAAPRASA